MANEATLVIETEVPIPFTCAEGTAIPKGTILKLNDLMTVTTITADNDLVAGIAKSEKIADDGMVRIDVYRGGIFRVTASGSIAIGDPVGVDFTNVAENYVISVVAQGRLSGARILGTAMEAATDDQTLLIELNPKMNQSVQEAA